jgi:CHASE2 domain-containing sensor protein
MTLKRKLREQWMAGRAAAITAMLLGVFIVPFPTPLERWSFDWLHSSQPATNETTRVTEVAMIYMDDLSHNTLGQTTTAPWDRGVHAQLVDLLSRYSVKAIAFDILFASKETNEATVKLAEAIRMAPVKTVLAADLGSGDHSLGGSERMNLQLPDPALLSAGAQWGFAQLQEDGAYAVREHFHGSRDVPSLSWRLATLFGAKTTQRPESQRQKRWLHYYGLHGTIPFLRYEEVLHGSDTNIGNFLRGRVVFIGSAIQPGFAGDRRDQFKTPYWQEPAWPGVDFHATQYLNLIREDWLRRPDPFLELFGIAVSGLLIGIALARLRPVRAIVAALVLILLVIVCASAAMWQNHIWFNWCAIAGIQVPLALAFSVVRNSRQKILSEVDRTTVFADPTIAIGKRMVADHEILRCIGGGSYGEVWLARSVTGTFRAVKLIECRKAEDPRLEREFAGLKKFEPISRLHPGLVHVLHVGRNEATGQLFYVMELADSSGADPAKDPDGYVAKTLKSELQSHDGVTATECTRLSLALTAALAFLHEQGLIHRDIKPSNIIFVAGQPKLADIGLVAAMDDTMSFVGTEGFIPPEGPGTTAADVYSLGKVLSDLLAASRHSPVLDNLHAIVGKATAQNVAHRYRTATEMLEALRNSLAGRTGADDANQTAG